MARSRHEIKKDFQALKESGVWRTRSGHTRIEEEEKYRTVQARLKTDFADDADLMLTVLAGDDKAFENRVGELINTITLTRENAKAAIDAAKQLVRNETENWQAQRTSPLKINRDLQEVLAPAIDYLVRQTDLNVQELASCTPDEMISWVERYLDKLDFLAELTASLNA
jgi:polyhydroxyalkanoate synthesis regulator phasin